MIDNRGYHNIGNDSLWLVVLNDSYRCWLMMLVNDDS